MYVVTGATGNTGHRVAEKLLEAGKEVVAIGRDGDKLAPLVAKGAKAAVGSLEDTDFLSDTFQGATAVYALIPPKWDLREPWRDFQRRLGKALVQAISEANVNHVLVLSSNGAHLPKGAGPVSGLYEFEQLLKAVGGLNVMSLRAGYFMQNLYANIGMIKSTGMFGSALGADVKLPVVHTDDIADAAVKHLLNLDFSGFEHVFVSGQRDLSMAEIASVLGAGIGKPDLQYVQFSPEQFKQGMMGAGIPETIADGYNELFASLNSGEYLSDYSRTPENTTPTSIEDFAKEFAAAYKQG